MERAAILKNKLAYSYQLSLAIISVCLVSERHKSSTLTEKMAFLLVEEIVKLLNFLKSDTRRT